MIIIQYIRNIDSNPTYKNRLLIYYCYWFTIALDYWNEFDLSPSFKNVTVDHYNIYLSLMLVSLQK